LKDWREVRSHEHKQGKRVPGRGHSKCKGPEAGPCLECLWKCKEANVAGTVCNGAKREREFSEVAGTT
jgi:hypothetical protein